MTLVELMVVVAIAIVLVAAAVPIMRPALKDRKLREASRQLNTFIANAKARAAETGRPVGIWIARDTNYNNSSYQIFLAESPPPFAGETIGATATLIDRGDGFANQASFTDSQGLVKVMDTSQFNYKGPKFLTTTITAAPSRTGTFMSPSGLPSPRVSAAYPPKFPVFRQPIRSSGSPLELPGGIVIDLEQSGVGTTGNEMSATGTPVVFTFRPTGGVDRVYGWAPPNAGTIHMLIGRIEQVSALEPTFAKQNLADPTVLWVSVGHLTGTITTAENVVNSANPGGTTRASARSIANSKQTMGGR
jgi:type II secretory pathway pseudopilin PulG